MNRSASFHARSIRVGIAFLSFVGFAASGCGGSKHSPTLTITSPAMGATLGTADDKDPASPGLQYDVVVDAEGLAEGEVVSVFPDAAAVETNPDVVSPYQGVVGAAATVVIRVTLPTGAGHLLACARTHCAIRSAVVDVTVNPVTTAPTVTISAPTAGLVINTANFKANDCDPTTPALDIQVSASTNATAGSAATIQVGSGTPVNTTVMGGGVSSCVPVSAFGMQSVVVTVTDTDASDGAVGTGMATVSFTYEQPAVNVTITAPTDGLAITQANESMHDCNTGTPTLDLQVTATTSAANGSSATITVGSTPAVSTTVMSGGVSACVPVNEFGTIVVSVVVTDATLGQGMAGVSVTYAAPAGSPIAPIQTVYADHASRRQGKASLRFAAVTDGSGMTLASYEVRCSIDKIDTQAKWDAATVVANTVTPKAAGTETIPLQFKPSLYRYCLVRGHATGASATLTPLAATDASTLVNPGFEVDSASSSAMGLGTGVAVPVGDVNGDTYPDFVQTGEGSAALYFGGANLTSMAPNVVFTSDDPVGYFGAFAAGLGDFNGDGRPDFAVANPYNGYDGTTNTYGEGIVYVLFGRPAGTAWPATMAFNLGASCPADLCIAAPTGSDVGLGQGLVGIGNYDKDAGGLNDLAIGAPGVNQAIVILGSKSFPAAGTIVLDGSASEPAGFRIQGTPSVTGGQDFAYGILSLGDINKNGFPELGAYRPGYDTSLAASTTRRSELFRIEGRAHSGTGMTTVSAAADLQLALSDPTWNDGKCVVITVYTSIATADFDDDGILDIACSEVDFASATIVYGQADGTFALTAKTSIRASVSPDGNGFAFFGGYASSPVFGEMGDVDMDGREDFLLGNFSTGPYPDLAGAALFFGRAGRPATIDPLTDTGFGITTPGTLPPTLPRRVAYVGDLNKDGWVDVVVNDAQGGTFVLW